MRQLLMTIAAFGAFAAAAPASAANQSVEGLWANAKGSVIVEVGRCGNAYCGTINWADANNRKKGATPGTRVLSDLRAQSNGVYKGRAFEPKRDISGSATVRQIGPNTMVVKGCAIAGLICKEQRWTRVGS